MRLLLILLLLTGCASVPESPWTDLTVDESPAATAVDCGSFPLPTEVVGESLVYDNAGVNDLEAYRLCTEANILIVGEHAAQIAELKRARAALVHAGQSQRQIADMRAEMLSDERKHNAFMSVGYWVIILALAL